jgi:hypothetical protein
MIKTLNQSQFIDETNKYSESYKDKFTHEGKKALFEYLEQYEEDTETKTEFDYIALCCEYTEFDSFADLQAQYPDIKDMEDLQDHTIVIPIDNAMKIDSFIIANF